MTSCKIHPNIEPVVRTKGSCFASASQDTVYCPACRGAKGGHASLGVTSIAKARSSAANGKLGGRPPGHGKPSKIT